MSSKIWFTDKLSDILSAIELTSNDVTDVLEGPAAETYRKGFQAALNAMRQAVGIYPTQERAKTLSQARLPDYRRRG